MATHPTAPELTIGRLARAAQVNIETIRYYQKRNLLPTPSPKNGAFRTYPTALVDRIRFIKRAQELGFSLAEIVSLLALEDGTHRRAIRKIAENRLVQVREKLADLGRVEHALSHLIHDCETHGETRPCPIIATLADTRGVQASAGKKRGAGRKEPRRVAV